MRVKTILHDRGGTVAGRYPWRAAACWRRGRPSVGGVFRVGQRGRAADNRHNPALPDMPPWSNAAGVRVASPLVSLFIPKTY